MGNPLRTVVSMIYFALILFNEFNDMSGLISNRNGFRFMANMIWNLLIYLAAEVFTINVYIKLFYFYFRFIIFEFGLYLAYNHSKV